MTTTPAKGKRSRLKWGLGLCVAAAALWLLLCYTVAARLAARARPRHDEATPALAWGKVEALRLATSDDQDIGAWYIDGKPDRPGVVLMHGNGGSRSGCLKSAEMAAAAGCPVLLVTARAHGDSTGDVNDFGYSARHDIAAGVGWLHGRRPGGRVVVWGQSLGSAAALFAARDLGGRVEGYLLESPYQDLWTALRNRTRLNFPPVVELAAYFGTATVTPLVLPYPGRISPLEAAGGVPPSARVLILAGGVDTRARPEEAEAIASRIGAGAEVVVFDGADHGALEKTNPAKYRAAVLGFLDGRSKAAP